MIVSDNIRMAESIRHKADQILEAIRNKDGDQAEKVAAEHISNTVENLKQYDLDRILQEK